MYVTDEFAISAETEYRRDRLMALRQHRRPRRAHRRRRSVRPRMARAVAGTGDSALVA